MTLDELITALDAADPTLVLPHGFTNPHSYRGYYDELAFEPASNVPVADMLADARSALGATFTGWKGGDFVMRGYTDCWLAQEGSAGGETLGPLLLQFMLDATVRDAARTASGQQPETTSWTADGRHGPTPDEATPIGRVVASNGTPKVASKDSGHACTNCDGIDPDTCLTNPQRTAVGQPAEAQATDEAPHVRAVEYVVNCLPEDDINANGFEVRVQYRGAGRYAVIRHGEMCLGADGTWDFGVKEYDRGDEWLNAHRFDLDTALRLAKEQAPLVTVNGHTIADARRMAGEARS